MDDTEIYRSDGELLPGISDSYGFVYRRSIYYRFDEHLWAEASSLPIRRLLDKSSYRVTTFSAADRLFSGLQDV